MPPHIQPGSGYAFGYAVTGRLRYKADRDLVAQASRLHAMLWRTRLACRSGGWELNSQLMTLNSPGEVVGSQHEVGISV